MKVREQVESSTVESHAEKTARQQSQIIANQELLLIQQGRILEEQASKLRKIVRRTNKKQKEAEEKKQMEAVEKGEAVTSSGKCKLENLAPHLLKFLNKEAKKQDVTVHEIKPDKMTQKVPNRPNNHHRNRKCLFRKHTQPKVLFW